MAKKQQIVVRGQAERTAPADVADLSVVVQVDHTDQAVAFERASEVAHAVDLVLAERRAALGPRQRSVVVVQPTIRWSDGEQQRTGWRASRSTNLEVTTLDEVTPLLAELVGAGAVVHGPMWRLHADHPVMAEARTAAALDARARADSYAAGLDLRVGRIDWAMESTLRPAGGGGVLYSTADASAPRGADLEVEPAELTVRASVDVAFGIER